MCNNRVFLCIDRKVSPEKNYQVTFFSTSHKILLILLLFHCDLNPGSTFNINDIVSCGELCENTVMLLASVRPYSSYCEDGVLYSS